MDTKDHHDCCSSENHPSETMVVDPVCGMKIDSKTARGGTSNFEGLDYFFCNPKCKKTFDQNPASFVHKTLMEKIATEADRLRIYTCPMHPEIRQPGPGSCPLCGMALEPE